MLYLNKIERSFLTVFDDSANKTKKHNPKELRKREPKKQKSKENESGWSSDFEKRNIKR
jgi:hypothetical protein